VEYQNSAPNYGEAFAKGEELHNYTTRKISEDGTYAIVTTHSEKVEHIPQPPTPEEIAAQKKAERIAMAVVGSIIVGVLGIAGWASYKEEQNYRRNTELEGSSGA
jgi:hypothetical protein